MRNRIFPRLALFLVAVLLSGRAALPCLSFLPIMGSAYEGYVVWKSSEATKKVDINAENTMISVLKSSETKTFSLV